MKGIIRILVPILALALCTVSCGVKSLKDVEIKSAQIKSVTPVSGRAVDAVLVLEVSNPARSFTVSDIEAKVNYLSKHIGNVTADGSFYVPGKSCDTYRIPCHATLADGVSVLSLMPLIDKDSFDDVTADAQLRFRFGKKGKGKIIRREGINIGKIVK